MHTDVDPFATWIQFDESRYFVSGSNHAGEIVGLAQNGSNVGVAAPEVNEAAIAALLDLQGAFGLDLDCRKYARRVFVDSGAFSEVSFAGGVRTIVAPMTDAKWKSVFAVYERLAAGLGAQLYVVAPDAVGDQDETLRRLATYGDRVRALNAAGVNVILPVQKGARSMFEFALEAVEVLGFLPIFGVPMNKDATTIAELQAFAGSFPKGTFPRFHLLGMGPKSKRYAAALLAIQTELPGVEVFADSVRMIALVGKTGGKGGGPRPITAARARLVAAGVTGAFETKRQSIGIVWHDAAEAELAKQVAAGWYDPELVDGPHPDLASYRAAVEAAAAALPAVFPSFKAAAAAARAQGGGTVRRVADGFEVGVKRAA